MMTVKRKSLGKLTIFVSPPLKPNLEVIVNIDAL